MSIVFNEAGNGSPRQGAGILNLQKNQILDLSKAGNNLTKLLVGTGWDVPSEGSTYDLDLSAFLLNANGRVENPQTDIVFFNAPTQKGIKSTGDNRTGAGDGDDEQIIVNIPELAPHVKRIVFIVNIFEAEKKSQVFGNVKNAFIRLVNDETNEELCNYNLTDNYGTDTSIIFAELFEENGNWNFKAIGEGKNGDLNTLIGLYM